MTSTSTRRLPRLAAATTAAVLAAATLTAQGATYAVSLSAQHLPANGRSLDPSLSRDGLLVAFTSFASDLVPNDTNGVADVFVKDLISGAIERVAVGLGGASPNGASRMARLSGDGRFVAFESDASNLVANDTNGLADVFLFDRALRTTIRCSEASGGAQANGGSSFPAVSGDGRLVAFTSQATNLAANDANGRVDVYVHDRTTRQTTRASVSSAGVEAADDCYAPAISGDGRWVAFTSPAANLVANDTNGVHDVFLRDLLLGVTVRASVAPGGVQPNADCLEPSLGAGGRWVAFHSAATNLASGDVNGFTDVFRVDRNTGVVELASVSTFGAPGWADSRSARMDDDGRRIAFTSEANELSPVIGWFADVFVRDLSAGTTTVHSVSTDGRAASEWNGAPALSGDGRYVAFASLASNLVPNDVNQVEDVLVNETSHHLTANGWLQLGVPTALNVRSPRDAGKVYAVLAAFGTQFGTRLGGRLFALDHDPLLAASTSMPSVFGNFVGTLDAAGAATATATIPPLPGLAGLELDFSYTVIDLAFPTGFLAMANSLHFQVSP